MDVRVGGQGKQPKRGATTRRVTVGATPPRMAYVLGQCADLDEAVGVSAHASMRGLLLDRQMGSGVPAHRWLTPCGEEEAPGCFNATFGPDEVAACQQRLDASAEQLRGLLSRCELSCWVAGLD